MPDFCQTMSSLERVLKAYEQAGRALPLQYQCQPAFQPVAILIAICEVPVTGSWWSQTESNRRHPACKAGALPTELRPHSKEQCEAQESLSVRVMLLSVQQN